MKEIGSEFWLNQGSDELIDLEFPQWLNINVDNKLLLSGRTAIHFVLMDIQKNNKINTVYFPSYCCQSMLQPFIDVGINIIFYDVRFENGLKFNIDTNQECDIFFAMNYFGFSKGRMDSYIDEFKQRNITIIEDSTHSLLSDKLYNPKSDYIVASLRKWFPIMSGGLAVKTSKQFEVIPKGVTLKEMVRIRKSAMLQKGRYMNVENSIEKPLFLEKYSLANEMLDYDYALYSIDKESYQILQNLDIDFIMSRRKENSRTLFENLPISGGFKPFFSELESGDCPIFIPIIFNSNTERNRLREYLTNNNVYCPIHWPKPTILYEHNTTSIYDSELSLVADQRYEYTDMQYLIRRLLEYYE
jgi:hypothetical protein